MKIIQGKHYHCPVNGWDCPYYKATTDESGGICLLENPYEDCDDFASMYDEDEEKEDFGTHMIVG